MFSAREENLVTEEEGSVRLAATRSDALESVRMARELLPSVIWIPFEGEENACPTIWSLGVRSLRFRSFCRVLRGTSLGTDGPGAGDGWLNAVANR